MTKSSLLSRYLLQSIGWMVCISSIVMMLDLKKVFANHFSYNYQSFVNMTLFVDQMKDETYISFSNNTQIRIFLLRYLLLGGSTKMENQHILDFIKSGKLNAVTLGDSKNQVIKKWGKPEDTSVPEIEQTIWKYGNVQIFFENGSVVSLQIEFPDYNSGFLSQKEYENFEGLTTENFRELLVKIENHNRSFEIKKEYDSEIIVIDNGVRVIFDYGEITALSISQ